MSIREHRWMGLALLAITSLLHAAPAGWEAFTTPTWSAWRSTHAAVVFTTTDCEHCPAVISELRRRIDALPAPRPVLRVVVTDAANLTPAAAGARWYAQADERRVFEGNELALRHAVSPRWRGETPFVALLAPGAAPRLVVGNPGEADLAAWSGRR